MSIVSALVMATCLAIAASMELPKLPAVFSTRVEATIVNKNYTLVSHEWVDEPNNVGRVDTYVVNQAGNETMRSSTYYLYTT